ncbi:hypothetical protein, unlikely [Trypanosoma brucei gambiense DAL972]|uniref:Uncharacterized protein n=1 Tax=Trypanosoma brucei gambiense (strain MHOM/CI/86/DAL972) TaxID=679716 RepID=D0AAP2_TRYB9|nr:hypothetical protein, unlikely [Trypanosoma brucei gambiense DAL972]CBH18743.1 hypothetical protein, unlikely [Trypanosoma brucei gambiense DAL972]|eukprot:XP_011781007.1 hypothetical protein, unlikely [Trypanosoma brucei gambiense DAL972]
MCICGGSYKSMYVVLFFSLCVSFTILLFYFVFVFSFLFFLSFFRSRICFVTCGSSDILVSLSFLPLLFFCSFLCVCVRLCLCLYIYVCGFLLTSLRVVIYCYCCWSTRRIFGTQQQQKKKGQ